MTSSEQELLLLAIDVATRSPTGAIKVKGELTQLGLYRLKGELTKLEHDGIRYVVLNLRELSLIDSAKGDLVKVDFEGVNVAPLILDMKKIREVNDEINKQHQITEDRFVKAKKEGKFDLVCAELCGWGHYKMKGRATFESRAKFEQWLQKKYTAQQATTEPDMDEDE